MCGIVGYIGNKQACSIILSGLKRLEYRGYDSAGIALLNDTSSKVIRIKGKVADLEKKINQSISINASSGIAHTRWATHGVPNEENAHPQQSNCGRLILVHNGIIENYRTLEALLLKEGYVFKSQTDTEVLVNFIDFIQKKEKLSLKQAFRIALKKVVGAYALALVEKNQPDKIFVAKIGSPLAIGIGKGEYFVASDPSPFVEYTREVIYLEDGQMALLDRNSPSVEIRKISNNHKEKISICEIEYNLEKIEKKGFKHFMIKEICEQPNCIEDTLRGRLLVEEEIISISGIWNHKEKFLKAKRVIIIACGTSWHAGLIGEYLLEEFARIPVEVEYASEFRYRNPILYEEDVVIAISQSGETADTLAAAKLVKEKGIFIFGICNVVGSSISRLSDSGIYSHAGPEIGVASTKAFTTQIALLALISLKMGKHRGFLKKNSFNAFCKELHLISKKMKEVLALDKKIKNIAVAYKDSTNFLYLGRGVNFPVALEGALKLKEISYIHAEGYPAAEMKHGPIALIDENMPVVIIATKGAQYEKIINNIQEIKARGARMILITNQEDTHLAKMVENIIEIPKVSEELSPLLTSIPLQLLAYHIAILRGVNVDQPRNLAKSVTVE